MNGLQRGFYQKGELEGRPQAHMIKSHEKCSSPTGWVFILFLSGCHFVTSLDSFRKIQTMAGASPK
jgi:hypothetical protein